MFEQELDQLTLGDHFFEQRDAQDKAKQTALEDLKVYADLAPRSLVMTTPTVNNAEFLNPIRIIFNALRIYFELPAMVGNSLNEQIVILQRGSSTHSNLALESIDFTSRLQQAITEVEQTNELTAAAYTGLYWQFLYPLYKSCERMINTSFWPIQPLVESVRWLNSHEMGEPTEPGILLLTQSRLPILTSLAYTLVAYYFSAPHESKDAAHKIVLKCYGQLPYSLQLMLLKLIEASSMREWANAQYPQANSADLLPPLLHALRHHRNEDGSSAQQNYDYQSWLNLANELLAPTPVSDETVLERSARTDDIRILLRDMREVDPNQIHQAKVIEYRIKPQLYTQLFQQNAQGGWSFKPRENHIGRHTTYEIRSVEGTTLRPRSWAKYRPEQPGIEFGIGCLAERLGLGGVVPGVVGNIRLNGKDQGEAVWISADAGWQVEAEHAADIKTLADVMESSPTILNEIDKASFTRAVIRVLTTNPEDDKGNDCFLVPFTTKDGQRRYRIVRIDNERAFFPIEKKETLGRQVGKTVLQVKSSLYCLAQMQENLDMQVLNEFAELDMYQVLTAWVKDLQVEHQRYPQLFTEAEIKQSFTKDSENITILAVMLHEKLMPELLGRLQLIQHIVRDVINREESLTGLELLRHVQPLLVSKGQETYYYAKAFIDYPAPEQAKERFVNLTKEQYFSISADKKLANQISTKSAALAAQQSLRLDRSLTEEDVLDSLAGKQQSPSQAQVQLESLIDTNASRIWHDLLFNGPQFQTRALAAFSELPIKQRATLIVQASKSLAKNPDAYTLAQQEIILKAIATASWQRLTLGAFAKVLTPELFEPIIRKTADSLVHLDISKCIQIRSKQIQLVTQNCYLLESLDVSDLLITNLKIEQAVVGNWFLPKLTLLKAQRCQNIKSIYLHLPALERLEAQDCVSLIDISAYVPSYARGIFTGCESLDFSSLKSILILSAILDYEFFRRLWNKIEGLNLRDILESYAQGETVSVIEGSLFDDKGKYGLYEHEIISHATAIILSHLPITRLNLEDYNINDDLIKILSYILRRNKTIVSLSLGGNKISSNGFRWLFGAIEDNDGLKNLNISNNPISPKEVIKIAKKLDERFAARNKRGSISENLVITVSSQKANEEVLQSEGSQFHLNRILIRQRQRSNNSRYSMHSTVNIWVKYIAEADSHGLRRIFYNRGMSSISKLLSTSSGFASYKILPLDVGPNPQSWTSKFSSVNDQLTELNLESSYVDDEVIEKLVIICRGYSSMALTRLSLAKNSITSNGLKQLALNVIPKLPKLTHLDLSDNDFDEFGLAPLIKTLTKYNRSLQHFDISGNAVGNAGMQILSAEYLNTNIVLQFLGLRDTSFTETIGYSRLVAFFKNNFTLLTVDIRGNLLLLPEAYKKVEEYLKRNQQLKTDINLLRLRKISYETEFNSSAEEIIELLASAKIERLNELNQLFSKLERMWNESIRVPYQNIKKVLKENGCDESHPLLADFTKARLRQNQLRQSYDQLYQQLSQPDYLDWKRNRVTIRIWFPGGFDKNDNFVADNPIFNLVQDHNRGHVAIESEEEYVSFWPGPKSAKGTTRYYSYNSLIDDEKAEGPDDHETKNIALKLQRRRTADVIITLYSLDIKAFHERLCNLKEQERNYKFIPKKSSSDKEVHNCASYALDLLIQAGIEHLLPRDQWSNSSLPHYHPLFISELMKAAKQAEEERFPVTKACNTLRNIESEPEKVRSAQLFEEPTPAVQESYVNKGYFLGWVRSPNLKLAGKDRWKATSNTVHLATETYKSTHDDELSFQENDVIEDLTSIFGTNFKNNLPNLTKSEETKKYDLPGWINYQQMRPAAVWVETPTPGTTLQKNAELTIIGKEGDLEKPDTQVICQEKTPQGDLIKHSLLRGQIRFQ